ncbi:ABC transporter ATP-binding protein [Calycomorphotria hydatis]|uniref:Putative ABC transporter ATP-binding protein YxlF n=1 Tax=Calycomorphotria hydatis TaxID=2528027 RepID=A0A517T8V2_9PLAN|nr:ABC transporter ATP-binding protein [Calycomorphotria hydatis]QDT64810.1 putative ABC transporter ATP-binding protein YxlF [Calycomorphotria hydatis]
MSIESPTNDAVQAPEAIDPLSIAPAIEIKQLGHIYKKHRALENVSLHVERGSIHGFVGPNGAGKTTTLKLISTLLKPQAGSVRVFGLDVIRDLREVRKKIGFMPDHFSMYRQMTVFEYLDFFGAAYGMSMTERDRVIGDLLALTDMEGRREDLIRGLSRGLQQRVSLARVLVNDPDLLLLDEPASGLDPRARIELMDILRELSAMGKTIFISSHILSELAELCDSVSIIDRGVTRYCGSMEELLQHTADDPEYVITFGADRDDLLNLLQGIEGVTFAEQDARRSATYTVRIDWTQLPVNQLLATVISWNVPIETFRRQTRHLNEAFMSLTSEGVRQE